MRDIRPGQRVFTVQFGPGEVISVGATHAVVALEDFGGLKVHCALTDLKPRYTQTTTIQGSKSVSNGEKAAERSGRRPSDGRDFLLRRTIEALRFGVVPTAALEALTLEYEDLKGWVEKNLPHYRDGAPRVVEVSGPFGSGKSHTMEVVRHVARLNGYLTASVEVDGSSVSLSNPKGLLKAIWQTLCMSENALPVQLVDLYLQAIKNGKSAPTIAPGRIDRIADNYRTIEMLHKKGVVDKYTHLLESVLTTNEEYRTSDVKTEISRDPLVHPFDVEIRPMIGQRVVERPDDFMQSLVGHAIISQMAGHRGLVVTIDELEIEDAQSKKMVERTVSLLAHIATYFKGVLPLPPAPLALFFATVPGSGKAGDAIARFLVEGAGGERRELPVWTDRHRRKMAERIFRVYTQAYNVREPFSPGVVRDAESELHRHGGNAREMTRSFIRAFVASLDRLYGPTSDDVLRTGKAVRLG